jgi:hypothetical protein
MMWRPSTERSCRSSRLSMGPSCPRLVSIVPPAGPAITACGTAAAVLHDVGQDLRLPPDPTAHADRMRCDAVPAEHPEHGLSGWKDPSAQPAGRGLLMPYQSTDPSWASRLSSPGRWDANTSSPAATVPASVGPAELPELSDPATAGRTRWGRRSRSSGPSEPGRTRSSRRSTATRRTELGVRRPHIAQMPDDRREQAISAIADLLVVRLEREAQRPAFSASGRGRVAGGTMRQEELP